MQAHNHHHQCLPARSPRQSVEQTRWSPLEARWDHGGRVATGLVGSPDPGCLYLPTLSDTTAQSIPACPILAYILILCAFYQQSVVQNHFWLVWNSRIPFPCKHYEQNHCLLDNHLLFPVPLQPKSSSAKYYVPVSWSISGTCYCICVCILLQPITQGLCHYVLFFSPIHNTFNLCQYVATAYISKRSTIYVCVLVNIRTKPL